MKKIIVIEWLKFVNSGETKNIPFKPAYRHGYWNVLQYSKELEEFLKFEKIQYKVTEEPML